MDKNNMKGEKRGLVLGLVVFGTFLLMINFASSFAVGSKYWEENPILVNPGETVDFFVVLQNIAGEGGDVNVKGSLTEGGDIVKFMEESHEYFVPFGEKKNVNLSVTISEDVTVGELRNIVVSFKIISGEGSEALGLGSSIERTIPIMVVAVVEEVSEENGVSVWVLLVIVALAILAFWFYRKQSK